MSRLLTTPAFVAAILSVGCGAPLRAQTIYATQFEEFNIGDDMLVGPGFWEVGNSLGTGSHGIDYELVSGLGNSAFLGFNEPSVNLVTVAVSHSFDPLALGKPLVEFESVLGVEDSSNDKRDTFSVIFLNLTGDLLASIEFRNSNNDFGIWYSDGDKIRDTEVDFIRGELHLLTAQMDFNNNTWSAQLDGIDLFNEETFHNGGNSLSLGFTGAQWTLANPQPSNYGNNFLLVADWYLQAISPDKVAISSYSRDNSQDTISFLGEPGFLYRLQVSDDLLSWSDSSDAPIQPEEEGDFSFSVENSNSPGYYRILREFTPPPTE